MNTDEPLQTTVAVSKLLMYKLKLLAENDGICLASRKIAALAEYNAKKDRLIVGTYSHDCTCCFLASFRLLIVGCRCVVLILMHLLCSTQKLWTQLCSFMF